MVMRRLNNENIKKIAKQTENLLAEYPQAKELFKSNAKTFKSLFDKWKLASDNQPQPYLDPSGSNGKDGYEYDEDDQMWFPVQIQELPPDPVLWEIDDKLCCHYVTLGIIRDMIYADKAKPIVKDILQRTNTVTDAFSVAVYLIENDNHEAYSDNNIDLALSQVKQDLAKLSAETPQENKAINKPNGKSHKIFGDKFELPWGPSINYKNLWHKIKNWPCVVKRIEAIRNFIKRKLKNKAKKNK